MCKVSIVLSINCDLNNPLVLRWPPSRPSLKSWELPIIITVAYAGHPQG